MTRLNSSQEKWEKALSALTSTFNTEILAAGECVNVAAAIAQFAKQIEDTTPAIGFVLIFRSYEEDGLNLRGLSHVAVTIGDLCLDAGGFDADIRWEDRWNTIEMNPHFDKHNQSEFEYQHARTVDELQVACMIHKVAFNAKQQDIYLAVLLQEAVNRQAPQLRQRLTAY